MLRQVKYFGEPILRKKCKPVVEITPEIRRIAKDLVDTMTAHHSLGIAAPQIGYECRVIALGVLDESDKYGNSIECKPRVFINPEITKASSKRSMKPDACLSIPGFYESVYRDDLVDIRAMDLNGKIVEEKALKGWRGHCFQHEIDHLDGILFIDHFTDEQKAKYKSQLVFLEMQLRAKNLNPPV